MFTRARAAKLASAAMALAALILVVREAPCQVRARALPAQGVPQLTNPFALIGTTQSSNGGIGWPGPVPPGYYLGFNQSSVQFPSLTTSNQSASGSGGSGGTGGGGGGFGGGGGGGGFGGGSGGGGGFGGGSGGGGFGGGSGGGGFGGGSGGGGGFGGGGGGAGGGGGGGGKGFGMCGGYGN